MPTSSHKTLRVLVLASFTIPMAAEAASDPIAKPVRPGALVVKSDCVAARDTLVARHKSVGYGEFVPVLVTLVADKTAWATPCYDDLVNKCFFQWVTADGDDVVGDVSMGVVNRGDSSPLRFRIGRAKDEASIMWSFQGKKRSAVVTSCNDGIWTARSGTSAITLQFNDQNGAFPG